MADRGRNFHRGLGGPWRSRMRSGNAPKTLEILAKWKATRRPRGQREGPLPWWRLRRRRLVGFHLVRVSYVFASLAEPILGRFWFFHLLFVCLSTFLGFPEGHQTCPPPGVVVSSGTLGSGEEGGKALPRKRTEKTPKSTQNGLRR